MEIYLLYSLANLPVSSCVLFPRSVSQQRQVNVWTGMIYLLQML